MKPKTSRFSRGKSFPASFFLPLCLGLACFLRGGYAAEVGIKYNRPKLEYPAHARADFEKFHSDRIDTVMIALPWSEWEPSEGRLDEQFIASSLGPLLDYCAASGMKVILSVHSSFWGTKGNWTMPAWLREKKEYRSATSALTDPVIRGHHISFLLRLIDETRTYPAVKGYNILNEPAVATRWYIRDPKGRADFDARWDGIFDIVLAVRRHTTQSSISQFLIVGNASADAGYEKYVWVNTGKRDLRLLWTRLTDKIASQGVPSLIASAKWYPGRARIRTEGVLTYATLAAWREKGDIAAVRTHWSEDADYAAVNYDYDAAYDYEALSNAAVPDLEAFYVWRAGSIEGSAKNLLLLDHRRGDRPTQYYFALRDLASGVDSFETLAEKDLPKNGKESVAFDPDKAAPGISRRWHGTGTIRGVRDKTAPGTDSRIAAEVILEPGQSVFRSVLPVHWQGSGVKSSDSFTADVFSSDGAEISLAVITDAGTSRVPFTIAPGKWTAFRVPLASLGITEDNVGKIREAGFENLSKGRASFYADNFVIRK